MRLLYLVIGFCVTAPVQAATLRTAATLQGSQVYLRDLFDDAGVNADRVLGPGPGPGGRIVVEARQLKAIAHQYGVDWQPISSGDRAILEWPGRPLRKDEAMNAIRGALVSQGAAPDCDIEMPAFTPPLVPAAGIAAVAVTQLDFDQTLGRFTAVLAVTAPRMDPIQIRVGGQVSDVVDVPVARTRLPAGYIAGPDDVRMARVHTALISSEAVRDPSAVIGMQLKRAIPSGLPISAGDLTRPSEVSRGEAVSMRLTAGGLALSGEAIALETGALGDRIRVRNIASQAVIEAVIAGPGQVRVLPGSSPISAQARLGQPAGRGG